MPVRVATFNCENLFSRSKILNLTDDAQELAQATAALKAVEKLKKLLRKPNLTATDKKEILQALAEGKGFFTFEEDRGKLISGNKVVAKGADDFFGHIRFNARDVGEPATNNTGRVVNAPKADVLCVVEVENRKLLGDFNSQVLKTKRFVHHMVIDGNDDRGIDVGILSNLPIRYMRSHVDDKEGNSRTFSRDCAVYETVLPDGRSLWMLCNHLKSKGFGSQATNDARRKRQATRLAEILTTDFNLKTDLVVLAGDLNDTPTSGPLSPLMGVADLHNIVDTLPSNDRFTHIFGNQKDQIDYLLVSKPLNDALTSVTVERRGMHKVPGHFPTITGEANAASDHAAIVAEFAIS